MHQGYANRPTYTGSPAHTFAPTMHPMGHEHAPLALHGFCPSCCHPKTKCGCGCRQCRKEPKELLVKSTDESSAEGSAFIGGGCCVHLSIEYAPSTPTTNPSVIVRVEDSEGTVLVWQKSEKPGAGYQIKECIVTTKPGADLSVTVTNMTARVRWCEIFSC